MLSLVQSSKGMSIAHEVRLDNAAEAKAPLSMIRILLACYLLKRLVLIADRNVPSVSNI